MSDMKVSKTKKKSPQSGAYAARLEIDYPEKLDRLSTFFRGIMIIPIAIILSFVTGTGSSSTSYIYLNEAGDIIRRTQETGAGLILGIPAAIAMMILFRKRYPRWWFDFMRELTRFQYRIGAYAFLLTDQYPSTVEEQSVHLEIDYPDVEKDLTNWMPLVKGILAIPHFILLVILAIPTVFVVFIAWFAILFTGKYPRSLFDFVVGISRWWLRVYAYVFLLVTDVYPSFGLK